LSLIVHKYTFLLSLLLI